jgi:G:T/U-mismatch repair DNA glycosylase
MTIEYARSRGMGLIGTNAMNDFWRARERVSMTDIVWNAQTATMRYDILGDTQLKGLTLIAPLRYRGQEADISVNSQRREYETVQVLGSEYAMWTIDVCGERIAVQVDYN